MLGSPTVAGRRVSLVSGTGGLHRENEARCHRSVENGAEVE
jgi:hypothetical protein